jgi:hypothetical protein
MSARLALELTLLQFPVTSNYQNFLSIAQLAMPAISLQRNCLSSASIVVFAIAATSSLSRASTPLSAALSTSLRSGLRFRRRRSNESKVDFEGLLHELLPVCAFDRSFGFFQGWILDQNVALYIECQCTVNARIRLIKSIPWRILFCDPNSCEYS